MEGFIKSIKGTLRGGCLKIAVCIAWCFSGYLAVAQLLPPPVQNYSANLWQGHQQLFSVAQDEKGVMYFAGNGDLGALSFDGTNWQRNPTTSKTFVRSLAFNKEGRLFVGGEREFGYFTVSKSGEYVFESLTSRLDSSNNNFTSIWNIHIDGNRVFFQANEALFVYENDSLQVLKPIVNFHTSHFANDQFFITEDSLGLLTYLDGELVAMPNASLFSQRQLSIYDMLASSEDEFLLLTSQLGLAIYSPSNEAEPLVKWDIPANALIKNSLPYCGVRYPNGDLAIGTIYGGLVVLSEDGTFIDMINENAGLQDNCVWNMALDNCNKLWLALDKGISCVDINSPVRFLNRSSGFEFGANAIERIGNHIVLGSGDGTYTFDRPNGDSLRTVGYSQNDLTPQPVSNIMTYAFFKKEELLYLAALDGVHTYNGERIEQLSGLSSTTAVLISEKQPDWIVCGSMKGVAAYSNTGVKLELFAPVTEASQRVFSLIENPNAPANVIEVWGGTQDNRLACYRFNEEAPGNPEVVIYDTTNGVPQSEINTFLYNGEIVFGARDGLYRQKPDGSFFRDPAFDRKVNGKIVEADFYRLIQAAGQQSEFYAIRKSTFTKGIQVGDSVVWFDDPFRLLEIGSARSMFVDTVANTLLLGGTDGFAEYNLSAIQTKAKPYHVVIREVVVGSDSLLFSGLFANAENNQALEQNKSSRPVLEYSDNALFFQFSAICFDAPEKVLYSFVLEGFDEDWSDWEIKTQKEYTNIPEGEYVFKVRAKNVFGNESEVASYSFQVLAPWYRTTWAYVLYIILFVLLVVGLLKLNSRRLTKANQRLKRLVHEKTGEIRHQKEEIEDQRDAITKKNKALMDSIGYAKSLQQAILPSAAKISSFFKSSFVLFEPRDVVSGDFYYFHEKAEHVFFAAVDCTGHGVPGALVSMSGSSLLDQIIIERDVNDPGIVLSGLNLGVHSVFRKEGAVAEANDGMDIALCVFEKESRILHFSGAHNPLIIVRNGEIISEKGDRTPIGGRTDLKFKFATKSIQTEPGDWVYIFSDGFADQFGGKNNRKYMLGRFKTLLTKIHSLPPEEQHATLERELAEWQGTRSRIDDVLVFGVKID